MSLENKYGIPKETVLRLINDGYLSSVRLRNDEIKEKFQELQGKCPDCSRGDLFFEIAELMRVSRTTVEKAVYGK